MNIMMLSRFLGWLSLGLGITEAIAPKKLARTLGMSRKAWLIRLFGLREMIAGVTVLAEPDELRGPALRVGGDILDLVVLAPALSPRNRRRGAAHTAFAMVLGVTALDIFCSAALIQNERRRTATAERARLRRSPSAGRLSRQHPATASV